jgi:hypothetical protein
MCLLLFILQITGDAVSLDILRDSKISTIEMVTFVFGSSSTLILMLTARLSTLRSWGLVGSK